MQFQIFNPHESWGAKKNGREKNDEGKKMEYFEKEKKAHSSSTALFLLILSDVWCLFAIAINLMFHFKTSFFSLLA